MIKSINIERFRCFNKTKGNDFGRINLLGGKNNAGKTAFLEALYLMNEPSNRTIQYLLRFRREDMDFIKAMPKRAWDNFFFNGLKENSIIISSQSDDNVIRKIDISCNESVEEFISNIKNMKKAEDEDEDLITFANSLNNKELIKSALHIKAFEGEYEINSNVFIASGNGIVGRGLPYSFKNAYLIPASYKQPNEDLAEEFDKAKFEGGSEILLDAFKLIDDSIEKVETFKFGKSAIYLKRKGENYMPLTLFGDAMNKIADFILRIVNNKNSLILLDEIENGIHHSNQKKLWEMIFKLTKAYNVQLFTTSHSEEMIEAFKNVIVDLGYQNEARYFVLERHTVSNEVIVQKLSIDVLSDKLTNKKPHRGE
jgi:predicted ATPase